MIRTLAAFALLAASSQTLAAEADPALSATAPWWERVTVTIAGDGKAQGCLYETSLEPKANEACEVSEDQAAMGKSSGNKAELTRITFERRFTPGAQAGDPKLQPGDTLIGGQVISLAFDAAGAVKGCKVVAASGEMTPEYGCKEAAAEKFEASASDVAKSGHEGVMTILVYGHNEHVV